MCWGPSACMPETWLMVPVAEMPTTAASGTTAPGSATSSTVPGPAPAGTAICTVVPDLHAMGVVPARVVDGRGACVRHDEGAHAAGRDALGDLDLHHRARRATRWAAFR